jgi:galactose-1-phosphate uridylyltransferase
VFERLSSNIRFEKEIHKASMLSPLKGFKLQAQTVERRKDTLLDRWCRINVERAKRPKDRVGDDLLLQLVESSRKGCYFCPDKISTSTPLFPRSLISEGRLKLGQATVFPNLFPFAQHHAVVVLTKEHFVPLDGFKDSIIERGLEASIKYLRAVKAKKPKLRYCSINWNHMPSAAASILHPHYQVLVDSTPTRYVNEVNEALGEYHLKFGGSYWDDLVEVEKGLGERFIAEIGSSNWLASFCPFGNNDVIGISSESPHILDLDKDLVGDLARGISAILTGYHKNGVQSFNLALFSGPLDAQVSSFPVHVRMISRPSVRQMYTADAGFMEMLHEEVIVETSPEDTAKSLKSLMHSQGC